MGARCREFESLHPDQLIPKGFRRKTETFFRPLFVNGRVIDIGDQPDYGRSDSRGAAARNVQRLSRRKRAFHADWQHMRHAMLKADYSVNQVVAGKAGLSVLHGEIAIAAESNESPEAVMLFALIERWGASVAAPEKPLHLQALARNLIFLLSAWYGSGLA